MNRKTGDYHCHRPQAPAPTQAVVKKSRSGICHDRSSSYYAQTVQYEAFDSLQACFESGGRLPR